MTTQTKYDEVLKMALEALDQLTNAADTFSVSGVYFNEEVWAKKCLSDAYFAINAIEQTLAQQSNEQVEPVAWLDKYGEIHKDLVEVLPTDRPLYTHPPVPTAQPKPLTDEQIDAAIKNSKKVDAGYAGWVRDQRREFGRAIEVAHGIKE